MGFDRCSHRFSQLFLAINGAKGTGCITGECLVTVNIGGVLPGFTINLI